MLLRLHSVIAALLLFFAGVASAQVSNPSLVGTPVVSASASDNLVIASTTPTANALVIAVFAMRNGGTERTLDSITDGWGGLSWSTIVHTEEDEDTGCKIGYAWAIVGASPSAGTLTGTLSGTTQRSVFAAFEVTGHHVTTPLLQNKEDTSDSATPSLALDGSTTSGSITVGFVNNRNAAGFTGDETELSETASGGSNPITLQIQYSNSDPPVQTHGWTGGSTDGAAVVVLEIQQAAAGATPGIIIVQ